MLHQIKAQQFYANCLVLISPLSQSRVGVIKIVIVINCNLITFSKVIACNCN